MTTATAERISIEEAIENAIEMVKDGYRTILEKNGVRFAVVPYKDAEYMEDLEDEEDLRVIAEMRANGELDPENLIPWEQVMAELDEKHGIHN